MNTVKIPPTYLGKMGSIRQLLYFNRYPLSYEETRDTNPVDFLLSGIFAAIFVNITSPDSMLPKTKGRNEIFSGPIKRLLDEKWKTRCLIFNHSFRARQHIDIYEKMLQRRLIQPERKTGGNMRFNEIRALACDLGINTYRKKKNEIIHSISLTK